MKTEAPYDILKRSAAIPFVMALFILSGCLPSEQDVSERYNNINERAQIENTGLSLMQAANDMTGHLIAASLRRKAPLDDIGLTTLPTVTSTENPIPTPPIGVRVVACADDKLAALAYFTAEPKGTPPLKNSSGTMTKALSQRFGASAVGVKPPGGTIQLPKVAVDIGCTVGSDIIDYSPIFASGFEYRGNDKLGMVLPDAKKVTYPSITRDITIPCPTNFNGVIKREQVCKLIAEEDPNKTEKTVVKLGEQGKEYANDAVRLQKTWECTPDLKSLLAPTAQEIADFCIDPSAGLAKQADNTINLNADSWRKILDGTGQYYTFNCRQNSDRTSTCDSKPYMPTNKVPRDTFLRCDPEAVPEQYVINPTLPIKVDAIGKVISETPAATKTGPILGNRECGQGWTGDLIAGYQVRACRLVKVTNGVATPIKLAQTIYKIGYVAARCNQPPKEATYYCPRPYNGQLTLRESNYMLKPLALQLGSAPVGDWTPSTIPYRIFGLVGNANAETIARAAKEGYRIARSLLQGVQNPTFSSRLEGTMQPDMKKEITGCKLAGQSCELPPDPINIGIIFDRSGSMTDDRPAFITSSSNRLQCEARLDDIFTDKQAACEILRNNSRDIGNNNGRPIESVLGQYLIEPSNPVFNNMMLNAITNNSLCGDTTIDKVGYCTPGKGTTQSSCAPGRCSGVSSVSGRKLVVAEDQLQTAINYIPPGSEVWYTEFVNGNNSVEPTKTRTLCDVVKDPNCDFATALSGLRGYILENKGLNNAGTPLMEATARALEQFGPPGSTKKGILMYFSDGREEDGIESRQFSEGYNYPYGSLCEQKNPSAKIGGSPAEFCRAIGITEANINMDDDQALGILQSLFQSYRCEDTFPTDANACSNIRRLYDPGNSNDPADDKLVGTQWKADCGGVGNAHREPFVNYVQNNYPNLKVFILNLGSPELAACPRDPNGHVVMVPVDVENGFEKAFAQAFGQLNTRKTNPEEVCTRIRAASFPNAISY